MILMPYFLKCGLMPRQCLLQNFYSLGRHLAQTGFILGAIMVREKEMVVGEYSCKINL